MPTAPPALAVTDRTKLHRKPARGSHERATIDAILDEAWISHVACVAEPGPVVIPTMHVRVGDQLYLHGSVASRMLHALSGGIDACIAVTLLDGLVLSRIAIHHSVNYRSAVLFGRAVMIEDTAAKLAALAALIDRVEPNRSAACRPPNAKELARTMVLGMAIAEASSKVRSGPPLADEGEDMHLPYWAGTIPLHTVHGAPVNAPDCTIPWKGDAGR
jgi:nitroimidazol reductase NimA-like FMN-containing flavoprotein (pyridoxamine 5'-phosphate oxidase superfamily)